MDIHDKKIVWTYWNKVLAGNENRGLGGGSFFALNRALLFKWIRRFLSNLDALWVRVIQAIYGNIGCLGHMILPKRSSVWVVILYAMLDLRKKGIDLFANCKKFIGNGVDYLFWTDVSIGDSTLKDRFPRLYALELNKNDSVVVKFGVILWFDSFRHPCLGGAEIEQAASLNSFLELINLNSFPDRWVWDLEVSGGFIVYSTSHWIDLIYLGSLLRLLYGWVVPIKVNVFCWRMFLDSYLLG